MCSRLGIPKSWIDKGLKVTVADISKQNKPKKEMSAAARMCRKSYWFTCCWL